MGEFQSASHHPLRNSLVVEIEKSNLNGDEDIERILKDFFSNYIDIHEPNDSKSADQSRKEKQQALELQQQSPLSEEDLNRLDDDVEWKEQLPGYYNFSDNTRAKRLNEIDRSAIIRHIGGGRLSTNGNQVKGIVDSLKNGCFLSRFQKILRGLEKGGMADPDVLGGGGSSIFTRLLTEKGQKDEIAKWYPGYVLAFSPELLNRLDYYAYLTDLFGNKARLKTFGHEPERLVKRVSGKKKGMYLNEIMFNNGVSCKDLKAVVCQKSEWREHLIDELRKAGVEQVNGVALEDFVICLKTCPEIVEHVNK